MTVDNLHVVYDRSSVRPLCFLNIQSPFRELIGELSAPEIEGIYETQMSLEFRVLMQLGCICVVDPQEARRYVRYGNDTLKKKIYTCRFIQKHTLLT